ncbi:MAG: hypothetical protein I4N51_10885 [Acinetobacter sp.]|nr:hypothetical protein [Acinetobacter sp.]
MTNTDRVGDLELEQDLQYQQRSWVFQRIGWAAMSVIALAAGLGLTGEGWLSQAKVRQPGNPLWLEYERFGRFQSPEKLRIHIDKALPTNQIRIGISRKYLEGVQIQQVTPEPDSIELSSNRLIYSFKGTTPTAITFYIQPDKMGFSSGSVGLEGAQLLEFQQFIYP